MMEKEGQVTVFALVGIVLLVVAIFSLVIYSSITSANLKNDARKAVDEFVQSRSISYYVYTCIDTAANDVVNTYALQGATFWDYQEGYASARAPGITHINYSIKPGNAPERQINVSYAIWNETTNPITDYDLGEYPYGITRLGLLEQLYEQNLTMSFYVNLLYEQSGFFGLNNFTRLCYPGSNNSRSTSNYFSPCLRSKNAPRNATVEVQLQEQLAKRIEECIDFSNFLELANHNITAVGEPNVSIVFDPESLSISLEYPFTVSLGRSSAFLVKHKFDYASKLRFIRMHNYMLKLLARDTKDIFFDINTQHVDIEGWDSYAMGFTVVNFSDCADCAYRYDELLILEDNASRIGDQSLTLIVAVKNRRPALDYIHETSPAQYFDYVVPENTEITISPQAYDPDDKKMEYAYIGWKETFDEVFTCTLPLPVPPPPLSSCITVNSVQPHEWTASSRFVASRREAQYTTTHADIGPHNLTVIASDVSGDIDYQVLRILVYDLPHIELEFGNAYADIPDEIISIEDPFTLDASGTTPSQLGGGTISDYDWEGFWHDSTIPAWTRVFARSTTTPAFAVPLDTYTIANISHEELNKTGNTELRLTVTQFVPLLNTELTASESEYADVKGCLPHRNSADPYPFPYNQGNDAYLADHACCLGDPADPTTYVIAPAGSSITCSEQTLYGAKPFLRQEAPGEFAKSQELSEYFTINQITPLPAANIIDPQPGDRNDVYKLGLERTCDGKRGNLCAGTMTGALSVHAQCSDIQAQEQCSGPSAESSASQLSCINYPAGETFESRYGGGTGICGTQQRCSTIGINGYGAGGPQSCQATCSNGQCSNTRDMDCSCSVSQCGAQCDETHASSWIGLQCRSGCSGATTCTFQQSAFTPCQNPQPADPYTAQRASCLTAAAQNGYDANTCYFNVGCTAAGGVSSKGQYCAKGRHQDQTGTYCLWGGGAPACVQNSNGICNIPNRDPMPNTQCPGNQPWVCNPNTGWTCA